MILFRRLLLAIFGLTLLTSCATPPSNSNPSVAPPTSSPAASTSIASSETGAIQVTLPLLDALLTDEKFVAQLKQDLKLTDDQIDSLRRASSEEISRLRETNAENFDGNATDARTRTKEKLRSLLGEQKARELASLTNEYWSRGAPSDTGDDKTMEMLKGPNAVPSDTRVVVNIPAFRMDLFQDGNLVKSYKIGIGYPEFPLPMGLRKAQTVIFNPTWTPPDSPWVAKMNARPGETIGAGDKDNPLGPIKIPIGLPSLIHGGKPPAKIGKFASHGCVGLTTPQVKDFTLLLARAAKTQEISEAAIASYLKDKERTKTVKLKETIPVELRYETIVLEDGKLHIYKDVYAQDTNTEENLRRVLEANGTRLEDLSEQQRTVVLNALNTMSANPESTPSPSPTTKKKPAKIQNEVVIELGALAQKGYPAPVNLDTGNVKKATAKRG